MTRNLNGYLPARGPSIYVPTKYMNRIKEYCEASAGPRCNLTGMRMHYWGDAPVIRSGQYCFKVNWACFNYFKYR